MTPRSREKLHSLLCALLLCAASGAWAETTTLNLADTSKVTSNVPVTLLFPVTRTGDLGYAAIFTYHTVDGTALAGTDYTAASGSITIPAGATSIDIPVTLAADAASGAARQFQLMVDSAVGAGPASAFAAQQAFTAGTNPNSVAAADLNGDGKPDLVAANEGGNSVSVRLDTTAPGAATPSYSAPQTFVTGNAPDSVTAADVNGDGKPDLVVANRSGNSVSVLLDTTAPGAATASFAAQQAFATGSGPFSITTADVNGDGKLDLITANSVGNTVSVLLNTTTPGAATPGFAMQQSYATGSHPISVAAADVNGDGMPDVIVANQFGNSVSVLLNGTAPGASTPSFAVQQSFAAGNAAFSVAVTDVNGDGKPDLAVANRGGTTLSVLLNTTPAGFGTPSFATQQTFPTGTAPDFVTTADVNGDGKPDLIATNSNDNTVSVLRNHTVPGAVTASFAAPQAFAVGSNPASVAATDVNGDGKPDLIVANYGGNSISVLLNVIVPDAAAPGFAAQQTFMPGAGPLDVRTTDLNGDGKPDLVVASFYDNAVSVRLNTTAPGATTAGFAANQNFATGTNPYSVTTPDVNGDGKPDLIVANRLSNSVSVLLNTMAPGASAPSFAPQQGFATGTNPDAATAADVNGDGKQDLVVANQNSNNVSVLLNTTAPGAIAPSFAPHQTFAAGSSPKSVAGADVNGDGRPDLIVLNLNDWTVSVLLNTTAPGAAVPAFAAQQTFATAVGQYSSSVTTADVNGDGKPDLITANAGSGSTVSVLLNTTAPGAASPTFSPQQTFTVGYQPLSVAVADVNGDGRPDLVTANNGNNNASVLINTTAPGATTPSFATQQTFNAGTHPKSVAAGDVNGDGKPDLVVANLDSSNVSVFLNTQYQATIAGSPATGTIVHDHIFSDGFGP